MPTPFTRIVVDAAFRTLDHALRRDATREVYAQVRDRIKGMMNFDSDLKRISHKSESERLESLLEQLKDFLTFLEHYETTAEESAERDLKS